MSNLIDRQAAINALDCINGVEEVLRSLPSANPEPCEDAVSRQEVADILENADPDLYVDLFNKLPSVTPKQRWIPVEEALPEVGGVYLVTDVEFGELNICLRYFNTVGTKFWGGWEDSPVLAWMPLPEPFKGATT